MRIDPPLPELPAVSHADRLPGLDALRGIAVILMIQQHLGSWLWNLPWRNLRLLVKAHPIMLGTNALGGLAAPLFVTLAGIGVVLFDIRASRPRSTLALRGLTILGLGYLLNLLTPSWFSPGSWYVLHLIGSALLLSPLLLRLPTGSLIALACGIVVAAPPMQEVFNTPYAIGNDYMGEMDRPGGVLRLVFFEGHFPLFPWLAMFLGGMAAARALMKGRLKIVPAASFAIAAVGGVLPVANLFFGLARGESGYRFFALTSRIYPLFPPLLLLLLAASLLLVVMFWSLKGRNRFGPVAVLAGMGRCSLSLLMVHVILFKELSRVLHFYKAFPAPLTGAIIVSVLAISAAAALVWQKGRFAYGAEWLVRKIAG